MIIVGNVEAKAGINVSARMMQDGNDVVDALVEGVSLVERDEEVRSVGYGGWPNMVGDMEFDAAVMNGDNRNMGAIGALHGSVSAVKLAREVMHRLPHNIITGAGATRFAKECGFPYEKGLMEHSQKVWKRKIDQVVAEEDKINFPDIPLVPLSKIITDPERVRDTTVFVGRGKNGQIGAATSTSGWAWKYPGRLGDSPICGGGFYADSRFGAAACTHTGEMTVRAGTARSIVMAMQMGKSLEDAIKYAVEELASLEDGFLGGVVIHAIDKNENHSVVNFQCDEEIRYWLWTDKMSEGEIRIAEKAQF